MKKLKNLQCCDKNETTQIISFTYYYLVGLVFLEKVKILKLLEIRIMKI